MMLFLWKKLQSLQGILLHSKVLNSLDAKSSAIAVRINPNYFRLQVVDNGIGISQENMEHIARKNFTSKCFRLEDLDQKAKMHGYKGESLWSISNVSKTVTIISKSSTCNKTFSKNIFNGKHVKVKLTKNRQSNGTTVSINGLFNSLPVRQKIIKREFELEEVVSMLRNLSIIYPQVSFSLRNDSSGKLLLKCQKYNNVIHSFVNLYPDIKENDLTVMKVRKEKVKIETLLLKEVTYYQIIQHIFVNRRPVVFPILRKFLSQQLQKSMKKEIWIKEEFHPLFIINLKCPLSYYDLVYEGSSPVVEFKNFDVIERCIEKVVSSFLGKPDKTNEILKPENKIKSVCGVSDLVGAIKGYGFKNWLRKDDHHQYGTKENGISSLLEDKSEKNKFQQPKRDKINTEILRKTLGPVNSLRIQNYEFKSNHISNNEPIEENRTSSKPKHISVHESENPSEININERISVCPDIISGTLTNECRYGRLSENYKHLENKVGKLLFKKDLNTTLFSNFTNSEDKGKDVIMYMFLKSTELFEANTDHEQSEGFSDQSIDVMSNTSKETIIESNVFYENIQRTKTHQMNKTVSVSVKVKRRRKKSPEEKTNLQSNTSFTYAKPKRKKTENGNDMILHTNLSKKDKATSPFFNRDKRNYDSTKQKSKENIDKIIQTTLSERNGNVLKFGSIHKFKNQNFEYYSSPNTGLQNYTLTLSRNRRQIFIGDESDANYHNDKSFHFIPPHTTFGKDLFQNHTSTSFVLNNLQNETKLFSDWNNSRLFHFRKSEIGRNARKIKFYKNFSIARESERFLYEGKQTRNNLPDDVFSMEVEKPIQHHVDDKYFDSAFMSYQSPPEKSFDFGNLSLSPIPKITTIPDQMDISNEIFHRAPIVNKVFSLKKFATEGHTPTGNCYWSNEADDQNVDDVKIRKKGNTSSQQFRKFHTEPSTNSRSLYVQKVKQNLDKLFMKPKYVPVHNKGMNHSNRANSDVFTRDSLENCSKAHILPTDGLLWKKFIERKRNQEHVKEDPDGNFERNILLFPVKSSKICEKNTKCLKHTNLLTRCKTNMSVSPDLFSDYKMSDEDETQKNYPHLTFFPNSQVSCEIVIPSSLPVVDTVPKNKTISERETDLPTLTVVGSETLNFVMTQNENIGQEKISSEDVMGQAIGIGSGLNTKDIDVLSLHGGYGEWIQRLDHRGNKFYFNIRTGMTSFLCPQQDEGFNFKARPEFMPKGLSPVLVHDGKVDKNISPKCRLKLHDEILKSYENELDIVKWEKYLKENDPKNFFDEIYKEKRNDYEDTVPNVYERNLSKFMAATTGEYKFSKTLFDTLEIIGQVDQKFIAAIDTKYRNLILFDQHAVHERIRLERLVREYEGINITCENITVFMIQNDMKLLKIHEKYVNSIGLYFRSFKNGLTVFKVPLCLYNKVRKEPKQNTWNLPKLVELLLQEILKQIKVTRGILTGSPKTIHQVITLEACRGAIKFGDCLTKDEIKKHIKKLSHCLLPFQCAHGRPTLIPILNLTDVIRVEFPKPQLKRLKKI